MRSALFGSMDRVLVAVVALLSAFPAYVQAQPSTFYVAETETQFSLNIANDTDAGDVYIYFTSPAYSWVGVGFGESMKNSLMFILYPSHDGKNVTVSPRIATGNSEPTFSPSVQLETLPGTGIQDDMFVVKAVCHYCRAWPGGSLDISNTAHPMIYAFGPGQRIQSNALDAPLKRHFKYGRFTMDMVAATGKGEVPTPSAELKGVELVGGMKRDHDRKNLAHAVLGCLALFVFWPLNVVVAGFFKRIGIHVGVSIFILAFLVSSYALGIATSAQYNRSKDYRTPHQIFAFISIFPILLLSVLPIRPIANLSAYIPRLHTPLTSTTLVLLILTGGLGLHLSSNSRPIILVYTAISLLVFLFCTLITMCVRRRGSAYARSNRIQEDDERELVPGYGNKKWGYAKANGKVVNYDEASSRSTSAASGTFSSAGTGHERSASAGSNNGRGIYGGGTMPGPQYLLNMHPGVPVYVGNEGVGQARV